MAKLIFTPEGEDPVKSVTINALKGQGFKPNTLTLKFGSYQFKAHRRIRRYYLPMSIVLNLLLAAALIYTTWNMRVKPTGIFQEPQVEIKYGGLHGISSTSSI